MRGVLVTVARFDVVVIGGGVVGLGSAIALGEAGRRVVVLEAEGRIAPHQSGHNSGVIHAGLYYQPGSLRAKLCKEGREALYAFLEREGVPFRRSGKLVVATSDSERPALEELVRRGTANGLAGLRPLDAAELRALEPNVAGVAAVLVVETGLVDYAAVAQAYRKVIERAGGDVRTGARVLGIRASGGGITVTTSAGAIEAGAVVNCGGLQADRVARMAGVDPQVQIVPFRGEYCELAPAARSLVTRPIYPVPNPAFPFLGVHFTPRLDGRVEAGPNAVLAWHREGYRSSDFSLRDTMEMLGFPGFWRFAARHWRLGLAEMGRSWSRARFVEALQKLVPAVRAEDLEAGGSGVRAQAVDREGKLVNDFLFVEGPRSLHVLNAPSPAATASLAIGRAIAARVAF
jgi:(S)-2-hydroxyglutarate dehydrogenase